VLSAAPLMEVEPQESYISPLYSVLLHSWRWSLRRATYHRYIQCCSTHGGGVSGELHITAIFSAAPLMEVESRESYISLLYSVLLHSRRWSLRRATYHCYIQCCSTHGGGASGELHITAIFSAAPLTEVEPQESYISLLYSHRQHITLS